jgi:hypothetical protein
MKGPVGADEGSASFANVAPHSSAHPGAHYIKATGQIETLFDWAAHIRFKA